jgi:hypothetical protein
MKGFRAHILVGKAFCLLGLALLTGCYSVNTAYQGEFSGFKMPGTTDVSSMSREQIHSAIEVAYLDGELTSEQARKAHLQLDVKGHLTQEQVAVISRDRLAKRDAYETSKEQLDVVRDVFGTGSSAVSDINYMKNTISDIFH